MHTTPILPMERENLPSNKQIGANHDPGNYLHWIPSPRKRECCGNLCFEAKQIHFKLEFQCTLKEEQGFFLIRNVNVIVND